MRRLTIIAVLGATAFSCGKKKEDKYAKASVAFGNTSAALAESKATGLAVKIKYVLLIADKEGSPTAENNYGGNNKGEGALLWGDPGCTTTTKDEGSGSHTVSVGTDVDCDAKGTYFNISRASAAVNAELNSQDAKVLPGTYRYIGLAFVGEQQGGNNSYNNVKWSHGASGVTDKTYASIQTEWTGKMDPPLELGEEQGAVLTLSYSLDNVVTTGVASMEPKVKGSGTTQPGKYDDCNEAKTACMNLPKLTISVAKK